MVAARLNPDRKDKEMNSDEKGVRMDCDQERALALMLSGRNVFLTGAAGTGKSLVVQEFKRLCPRRLAVLAPTGLAALNVGGVTVHRFFGLRNEVPSLAAGVLDCMDDDVWERLAAVEVLLIDEVSMLRADIAEVMDYRLRLAVYGRLDCEPFGGKQVIVVGDFFQLGPVVDSIPLKEYLHARFGGAYVFNCASWKDAMFETVELRQIHRQRDVESLELLNAVRTGLWPLGHGGGVPMMHAIARINRLCFKFDAVPKPAAITLGTTRELVGRINRMALQRLPANGFTFRGSVFGDFPVEDMPTDELLYVVAGERVMVLANNLGQHVNGDTGVVVGADVVANVIFVRLDEGREVVVKPFIWENYECCLSHGVDGALTLERKVVGRFVQFPLSPAYALTVHKAQGKTLNAVNLALGYTGCFAHGQLYTALSRCRSLANLTLDRPLRFEDCVVDPEVMAFHESVVRRGLGWF